MDDNTGEWVEFTLGRNPCLIHVRNKHKQRELTFYSFRIHDSCIVFGCNNKSDSENGRVLQRIQFFNDHRQEGVRRREKMDRFCNLLLFMLVS